MITAVYPVPGVYTVAPAASGRPRRALVDPDVSDLMRGEQEHSDDFWWAYRLAYGPVVAAINIGVHGSQERVREALAALDGS